MKQFVNWLYHILHVFIPLYNHIIAEINSLFVLLALPVKRLTESANKISVFQFCISYK